MTLIKTFAGTPIRWNDGRFVHAVEGAYASEGILLLWTLCDRDVPEDAAVDDPLTVTCPDCLELLSQI
jgi:hypothetical protein